MTIEVRRGSSEDSAITLVFGFSGSATSLEAMKTAHSRALSVGGALHVVHVPARASLAWLAGDQPTALGLLAQQVAQANRDNRMLLVQTLGPEDKTWHYCEEVGDPPTVLARTAQRLQAEVVLTGAPRKWLHGLGLSVPKRLARHHRDLVVEVLATP